MKKRKKEDAPIVILDGQLSIWDVRIPEKSKSNKVVIENKVMDIKVSDLNINSDLIITLEQQKVIDIFKIQSNVSRLIAYKDGNLGIETKEEGNFKTHYINKNGKEEFSFTKRSPVLPWDKIIYFSCEHEKIRFTKVQTDKLQRLLCKRRKDIKQVIHRKGDENIFVEFEDTVIDILPNGWELEFKTINHIECEDDEIYMIPNEQKKEAIDDVQRRVKAGDLVQALYGKEVIEGNIVREYGLSNEILNIEFDNETKHTAISRRAVLAILG
jgi:hypothetical protein